MASATPQAADPGAVIDSDWVLRILARPAPMRTNFVELRGSRLLKEPLRLSGEYQRPDETTLVRQVRAPYAETTTIVTDNSGAGQATIARAGKSTRTFSLSRVPELARLQASFGALLSGDRAMLERYYSIETEGTRRQWMMTLVPKPSPLSDKLRDIKLYGRGIELRCIETRPVQGDIQRTLLAGAARTAHDIARADALVALCRGDAQ
jgi:Outer membrane lipoprotein carrier protein LolA-like